MSAIDWSPLWISLHTAAATIVIVFFIGVIIAWWVERLQSQSLKIFADAVITLPMVLPPTVAGFFLLYFFGNNRFLGQLIYQLTGIKIAFSWLATVLAAAVISLPLMYRSARGALSQVDKGMLEAARSLGMTEWRIFWRIHLPNALPGIIAGGPARNVLELAGYKNIRTKSLGSNNKQNVVLATIKGLSEIKTPEEIARLRGKSVDEILN